MRAPGTVGGEPAGGCSGAGGGSVGVWKGPGPRCLGCARTRGSGWASRLPQGCWLGCPASPAFPTLTHLLPCGSRLAPRRPGVPHGLAASLPPGDSPLASCLSQPSASPWVCCFQHPSVRTCGPRGHGRGQGVHGRDGPPEEL